MAFGPVQFPEGSPRAPSLDELLGVGLRRLFPGLPEKQEGHKTASLYLALLYARRSRWYKGDHPFDFAEVDTVFDAAYLFNVGETDQVRRSSRPPIMVVLLLCTGKMRSSTLRMKLLFWKLRNHFYMIL